MLTPEQLQQIADHSAVRTLYDQLQEDLLRDMARRLAGMDWPTYTAMWQLQKLEAINAEREYIVERLAAITGESKERILAVLNTGCSAALAADDRIYTIAGYNPVPLAQNAALQAVIYAGYQKTLGSFENLTRTTADTATRQFEQTLDRAYMQIVSGGFSHQQATKNAVADLAKQGIHAIQYPSGHIDSMDVATRRALLTGVNQTALKVQEARADELGCDLVEVTAHETARPSHAEWQGKVYSRSGKDRNYKSLVDATGYGTGDGLGGWNCRHSFFPFFKGISRQSYSRLELERYRKATVEYNGQTMSLYDATQYQRAGERKIRALKREKAGLEGAGLDTSEVNRQLRFAQAAQKDFCEQTGLYRDYFRERGGKQLLKGGNPAAAAKETAKRTAEDTVSRAVLSQQAGQLANMDPASWPSYFNTSPQRKSQTAAFAKFINGLADADPEMRAIYASLGKLDNIPAGVPVTVSYTAKDHAVGYSYRVSTGSLSQVSVKIPKLDGGAGTAQTTAHELGHFIDLLSRPDPAGHEWITTTDRQFMQTVAGKHDVPAEIQQIFKHGDDAARAAAAAVKAKYNTALSALYDDYNRGTITYTDYLKQYKAKQKEKDLEVDKAMRDAEQGINSLEDIYDALTGGSGGGLFGHGSRYFSRMEQRYKEIWANYCALSLTRPDLVAVLQKHEPGLVAALDSIKTQIYGRIAP